jgi:hypothetical protein
VQARLIDMIVVYNVLSRGGMSMASPDFLSTLRYADGLVAFCPATYLSERIGWLSAEKDEITVHIARGRLSARSRALSALPGRGKDPSH